METFPGIFAAGDAVTGPRSIVAASASGRRVATNIDRYLRGLLGQPEEIKAPETEVKLSAGVLGDYDTLIRQKPHIRAPLKVEGDFDLLAESFRQQQALEECRRCMMCNHCIEIEPGCIMCNACVLGCPTDCLIMATQDGRTFTHESELEAGESGTAVMIKDMLCIRCGVCVDVCPVDVIYFKSFVPESIKPEM